MSLNKPILSIIKEKQNTTYVNSNGCVNMYYVSRYTVFAY